MLVFRCECEHVLGVEDDSSKGGVGECPSCGRIVRVPNVLVNANGRLRLLGTPSRATPSGAFRQIKDTKPESVRMKPISPGDIHNTNGAGKAGVPSDEASTMIDTRGIPGVAASVRPPTKAPSVKPAAVAPTPVQAEAETLDPIIEEKESAPVGALTAFGLPAQPAAKEAATSPMQSSPQKGAKKNFKSQRPPLKDKSANDPAAAVETHIDKNIAVAANAAASSKRRKAEAAPEVEKKKSPLMLIAVVAGTLILVAVTLYALGIFGGGEKPADIKPKEPEKKPAAVVKPDEKTEPARTEDKKPAEPAEPTKTEPAKSEATPDTKTDTKAETKEEPKAQAAPETKTEEKKAEPAKPEETKTN